jgi:hypothetical protein
MTVKSEMSATGMNLHRLGSHRRGPKFPEISAPGFAVDMNAADKECVFWPKTDHQT